MIPPVSDVFEAIATPARRAILDELVERDGQTLFELCNRLAMKHQLGLTRQAISQHLEVLESADLVTTVRQGKYKLHYFHTAPLETIVARWLKPGKKRRRE
jgi:DNA-binding transcriptional ArsR family regulator